MSPTIAANMPDVSETFERLDSVVTKDAAAAMIGIVKPSLEPCYSRPSR